MTRDEVEKEVRDLAKQVQERLDSIFAKVPEPRDSSPLNQAGLRNGFQIVEEYLNHNEIGLAFDHLTYMIIEPEVPVTLDEIVKLKSVAEHLNVPDPSGRARIMSRKARH